VALAVAVFVIAPVGAAQSNDTLFRPLELPAANAMRTAGGAPGPKYWQQRVNYDIAVTLDTAAHAIAGRESVRYTNNSPDTLRELWFQLDQNLYRPDSRGTTLHPERATIAPAGFQGGYSVRAAFRASTPPSSLHVAVTGTLMKLDLDRPLAPGTTVTVSIEFAYPIPENGSDRTGHARLASGLSYAIAQWFPRLVVYDDVRGWNTDEYLGQGEFYLEYGDIDYAVTVPRSFIVTGTGVLVNADVVLTDSLRARLARAASSSEVIPIISRSEVAHAGARPQGAAPLLTWHFSAHNVRDVAWAASPAFAWDAVGSNGVLVQALYPADSPADWSHSVINARDDIALYSRTWMPYPYPVATVVAVPLNHGMEYPMLVFVSGKYNGRALESATLHELGHQWFPIVVGSNERQHGWMDEGFTTFINWEGIGYKATGNGKFAQQFAGAGRPGPIMQPSDYIAATQYDALTYDLPDAGLELLRHQITRDTATFDSAFREYIRRWAFKHPTSADFFRSMNEGIGDDLSWFWRGWFGSTDAMDLGIDSVTQTVDAERLTAHLHLAKAGPMPMPVPIRLTLVDGTLKEVKLPVTIWRDGDHVRYDIAVAGSVVAAEIDAAQNYPDVRRANNVWKR
jgi:hypothetical protein